MILSQSDIYKQKATEKQLSEECEESIVEMRKEKLETAIYNLKGVTSALFCIEFLEKKMDELKVMK